MRAAAKAERPVRDWGSLGRNQVAQRGMMREEEGEEDEDGVEEEGGDEDEDERLRAAESWAGSIK